MAASIQRGRDRLAAVAAEGPVNQALVIANSDHLDETLVAILAARAEAPIVHALAANNRLRITRLMRRSASFMRSSKTVMSSRQAQRPPA